jgi:hypothetical protein
MMKRKKKQQLGIYLKVMKNMYTMKKTLMQQLLYSQLTEEVQQEMLCRERKEIKRLTMENNEGGS